MFKLVCRLWLHIVLLIAIQFIALHASSQKVKVDSLIRLLAHSKNDTLKVNLLNNIAYNYYTTDYRKTHAYCDEAIKLATDLNYPRGQARALQIKGLTFTFQNHYESAIQSEQQAIALADSIKDYALMVRAYATAGVAYNRLNDLNAASEAFDNALDALNKTRDKSYWPAILHNMGSLYIAQKKYNSAIINFLKAAELNQQSGNNQWLVQNYFGLGRTYNLLKSYGEALKYLSLATSISAKNNFYQPQIKSLSLTGSVYIAQKSYAKALSALQQAQEIATKQHITGERLSIYNAFASLFELQGDYRNEVKYLKMYQALYDSTYNSERSKLIAQYHSKFQDQQNKLVNERLKKEQALNQSRISERNYFLLAMCAVVILLLVFLVSVYKAYIRIKQKNKATQAQKDESEAQRKELENLNQLKTKLFSVIAHDLRGPFATLQGVFNLMGEGAVTKEDVNGILADMGKQITNSRSLLDNLLIWAKSQLNGFNVNVQRLNVYELTNETIEAFKADIKNKSIEVINIISHDVYAAADLEMVKAIIRNLLTNAVKFTPENGTITLTGKTEQAMVVIGINDTGAGLTEEQGEKLFKGDFYTGRSASNPDGTGLGLQICKEFVEKNGGKIWFEAVPGYGSTFYFTLPLAS